MALAYHRGLELYKPQVGDVIVWSGWFNAWYGIVSAVSDLSMIVIFEGSLALLLTMPEADQRKNEHEILLSTIKSSSNGTFAIMQQSRDGQPPIWYV